MTIGSWECGPNVDYGRSYLVGILRNRYGQEHAAITAFPFYENKEVTALLGPETSIARPRPSEPGPDPVPWIVLIAGMAIGLVVGVTVASRRS